MTTTQAATLFEYGIQTEDSDIRAHVSVANRTIYVFKTASAVAVLTEAAAPLVSATQPGAKGPTAEGWVLPVEKIPDLRRVRFPSWRGWEFFDKRLPTSEKGKMAISCVRDAMKRGHFPFWLDAIEDDRKYLQLRGTDLLVFCKKRVQVKCDYDCGDRPLGTGNLFLQKAERNPFGRR
jgi:hypothetical protein